MNSYDLRSKHVLYIGEHTGLDKAILDRIHDSIHLKPIDDSIVGGVEVVDFQELKIDQIEDRIENLIERNRAFDAVVFNIVHSDFRPIQFVYPELVNKIMNDNYGIFVESVRALRKNRGLNKGASIVAMSSISSIRAMKAKLAFCASKAALDASVRCLALELAPRGIRVNSIQKGAINTDFEKTHIQDVQAIRSEETIVDNQAPLAMVQASEVAELVVFLLSDATTSLTGQSIAIDGGQTI